MKKTIITLGKAPVAALQSLSAQSGLAGILARQALDSPSMISESGESQSIVEALVKHGVSPARLGRSYDDLNSIDSLVEVIAELLDRGNPDVDVPADPMVTISEADTENRIREEIVNTLDKMDSATIMSFYGDSDRWSTYSVQKRRIYGRHLIDWATSNELTPIPLWSQHYM